MAIVPKKRFLDVWLVEPNTVYREVPYTTAIDWIQQGRLLEDDMLRWSGQAEWFKLGSVAAFTAYLPRAEPLRVDDQAEALEQVVVDFKWGRAPSEDDEDVDMIPLIDVSLVLLIFFIMTASVGSVAAIFDLPSSKHKFLSNAPMWVGVEPAADGKSPLYSWGYKNGPAVKQGITDETALLDSLAPVLAERVKVELSVKGSKYIPARHVTHLLASIEGDERVSPHVKTRYLSVQ